MDAVKLSNVRRDIIKNNRLSTSEINDIKKQAEEANYNDIVIECNSGITEREKQSTPTHSNDTGSVQTLVSTRGIPAAPQDTASILPDDGAMINDDEAEVEEAKDRIIDAISQVNYIDMSQRKTLPRFTMTVNRRKVIRVHNKALSRILELADEITLDELNNYIYATAQAATESMGVRIPTNKIREQKVPRWKQRIQKQIELWRKQISLLDQSIKHNRVKEKKIKFLDRYKNKFKCTSATEVKEVLIQKMQAKAQRLRRYEKRNRFFNQNALFETNPKMFYRQLMQKPVKTGKTPPKQKVHEYWNNIWGEAKEHNKEADWIIREQQAMQHVPTQSWTVIAKEDISKALAKSQKWKSAGHDRIPNFWLHHLSVSHEILAKKLSELIAEPEKIPTWLTRGLTYLLPKSSDTENPKNYRPITCLCTIYKLLTSVLTERTYQHLNKYNIFPTQQKGSRKGSYGCKDQLLINRMITEECHTKKRNLSMAWIDYRKAFDSVPHSWILKAMELYGLSPQVIKFMKYSMNTWKTTLHLPQKNGSAESLEMPIRRGIFQGDSFSPLLFCIALIPLSRILDNIEGGFKMASTTISHLFYMDDLKLYAKDDETLCKMVSATNSFSKDIHMSFGIEKCAKVSLKRGKQVKAENLNLGDELAIQDLEQEQNYKYLGVEEKGGISQNKMKEKIRKEYYRRVRKVLKTELNSKNKIIAVNSLAVPVVLYSFNIVNWTKADILRMDVKTRKLLTINHMHHPKADVHRIYLPRAEGGRGMMQLENAYKVSTIGLKCYLESTNEDMLQCVNEHDKKKKLYSITKDDEKFRNEIKLEKENEVTSETPVERAKRVKLIAKKLLQKNMKKTWEGKPLHGQFVKRTTKPNISQGLTHRWLKSAGLKSETEGFLIAAQDQSLPTRNYQRHISKTIADDKCRMCKVKPETIDHLIAGCPMIAATEYLERHDKIGRYLHWKICSATGFETNSKWYEHQPEPVKENDKFCLLWDFSINTDRTIRANRPDIIVKDKEKKECLLIDMSVPGDSNVAAKEFEKKSKYKDLEIEIQRMWRMRTRVIPVVVGALGVITKDFEALIKEIPGNVDGKEIQKVALLGTAHILRKTLSIK